MKNVCIYKHTYVYMCTYIYIYISIPSSCVYPKRNHGGCREFPRAAEWGCLMEGMALFGCKVERKLVYLVQDVLFRRKLGAGWCTKDGNEWKYIKLSGPFRKTVTFAALLEGEANKRTSLTKIWRFWSAGEAGED